MILQNHIIVKVGTVLTVYGIETRDPVLVHPEILGWNSAYRLRY